MAKQITDTERNLTRDLADVIGEVVHAKKAGYARIVSGKRTLCYANPRRAGVQLDFRAADVADAPARLRRALDVKGTRARLNVNGKNEKAARALLEHVAERADA